MKFDIVRAWKDASYRDSLREEELAFLPSHPVGELELSDADLEAIQGAHWGDNHEENNHYVSTYKALICNNSVLVDLSVVSAVVLGHGGSACNSYSPNSHQSCNTRSEANANILGL